MSKRSTTDGSMQDARRSALPPGRPTRKTRPADRKDQILLAAARLFAEHGFEQTTVRQIAEAVQIQSASLFHHFATKEDLLHAILREPLEHRLESHQSILHMPGNAEQRLVASVLRRFRNFVAHWEVSTILQNDAAFFRGRDDFAYVEAAKAQSFKVQEAILRDGMRERLFRPDMDVFMMIGTISRLLSSAGEWFRSKSAFQSGHPEAYTFEHVVRFHIDCVLRLVRAAERLNDPIELDLAAGAEAPAIPPARP